MMSAGKTVMILLSGIALSSCAKDVLPEQSGVPYHQIADRNLFGLRPAPDPKTLARPVVVEPPPKITLTGITTILGKKIAFLTVASKKPGAPPEALMLAEGQAWGEIQVEQIDENKGIVKVINRGERQTLDFDHDGVKPTATGPGGLPAPPPTEVHLSAPNETPLTPEETAALIAVQTEKLKMEGDPTHKIMPPMPGLTEEK